MAKTSMKIKQQRPAKFSTREYTRCRICGRPHANSGSEESKLVKRRLSLRKYRRTIDHDNERSHCRYAYKNP